MSMSVEEVSLSFLGGDPIPTLGLSLSTPGLVGLSKAKKKVCEVLTPYSGTSSCHSLLLF